MTVKLSDMKSQLLTFDEIVTRLEATEPFREIMIDSSTGTKFQFDVDWAPQTEAIGMTEIAPVVIDIGGKDFRMTKEGVFQALSLVGLKPAYALKTPTHFIQEQLNYWFNSGLGESVHKLLVVKGQAAAFVRPTITSFSNLQLVDSVYEGVQKYYGPNTEILGDFKFYNSLNRTDVRFIVPRGLRAIKDSNMLDVPDSSQDVWSTGISLTNSLTGKLQTSVETYLFRWWCTNGATKNFSADGVHNRKVSQDEEFVYDWAIDATAEVLGGMEAAFDSVQSLVYTDPGSNTSDLLRDIYKDYKVPVTQRDKITDGVLNSNELTMYSIMNAVTEQANNPTLAPERVDRLLRVGGAIVDHNVDTTKAKVFHQGQLAGPDSENPYEVKRASA